jgi:uncharacterized protein YllA (UPF0747 family)
MPRVFGLFLDANVQRKQMTLGLSHADLFKPSDLLKKEFVKGNNSSLHLDKERAQVIEMYKSLRQTAVSVDITLEQHVEAQMTKHKKCLDNIQAKLIKAEKRNREEEMQMISAITEYVFPEGTLQERKLNFLSINKPQLIDELIKLIEPFDLRMHIFLD